MATKWTEKHFLSSGGSQKRGSAPNSGIMNGRPAAGSSATSGGRAGLDWDGGMTERRASGAIDDHWGSGVIGHGSGDPVWTRDRDEYAHNADGKTDRIPWVSDWPDDDIYPKVRPVGKDSNNG